MLHDRCLKLCLSAGHACLHPLSPTTAAGPWKGRCWREALSGMRLARPQRCRQLVQPPFDPQAVRVRPLRQVHPAAHAMACYPGAFLHDVAVHSKAAPLIARLPGALTSFRTAPTSCSALPPDHAVHTIPTYLCPAPLAARHPALYVAHLQGNWLSTPSGHIVAGTLILHMSVQPHFSNSSMCCTPYNAVSAVRPACCPALPRARLSGDSRQSGHA